MRPARAAKKKIRILIADHEAVFRLGLARVLNVEDDLRVVAQAENGPQLLAALKSFQPDVLFVQGEIAAELADNFPAAQRRHAPSSKLVITGPAFSNEETARHLKAGAAGVILKAAEPSVFVKAARKVMANERWLPQAEPERAGKPQGNTPDRPLRPVETLTRQEKNIISYLMQGLRNREIATRLSISEQTVKNHLRMIYDKVGVSDRLELVLYAIHQGLELPAPESAPAR